MTSYFPFSDPFIRLENVAWRFRTLNMRVLGPTSQMLWDILELHPELKDRLISTNRNICKVIVDILVKALLSPRSSPMHELVIYVKIILDFVSISNHLRVFAMEMEALEAITRTQVCFSNYTSSHHRCQDLHKILKTRLTKTEYIQDFIDFAFFEEISTQFRAISRAYRSNNSSEHFEFGSVYSDGNGSFFSKATASSAIHKTNPNCLTAPIMKFRLKTLEEHRYATRFEKKKKVRRDNWLRAKKHAYQLLKTGSRPEQAEALYMLLEIIAMHPHGCDMARLYLNVGSVYVIFEHYDEAARAYRNSLIVNADNWKAKYNLGLALAKKEDFADAKWHFDHAILMDPPDQIAEEIHCFIEEIENTQRIKTRKVMKETSSARNFTWRYLEAMKLMTASGDPAEVPDFEDYTKEVFHDRLTASSSHVLFDHAQGWKGVIASLLHRLYVHAAIKSIHVEDELFKYDPMNKGHISIAQLEQIVVKSTGKGLYADEKEELLAIFKVDGKIIYRMLIPNLETANTVEKILQVRDVTGPIIPAGESKGDKGHKGCGGGLYYAALDWRLVQQSYRRSDLSKSKGSFWFYLEMSLREWIQKIEVLDSNTSKMKLSICEKVLRRNQILTPMHLIWKGIIEPEQLSGIKFSDRGVLIYEAHQLVEAIKQTAAIVLQMFYKRVFFSRHLRRKLIRQRSLALGKHQKSNLLFNGTGAAGAAAYSPAPSQKGIVITPTKALCGTEDLKKRLREELEREQEISRTVMEKLDILVDEVIDRHFQYQREEEAKLSVLEVPVRTETRQKLCHTRRQL